jgi:DNA processing protein
LADGIDAAAHRGTLQAGGIAVAVVGSGLDRPYPPGNRRLWDDVASRGLLLTEAPLGGAPEAWRFPSRNRIIAALAQVVVVVESGRAGGSMITVREALSRDRTVLAVPGSVRSAASEGTNQLLADGIGPARDAADVLVALGLSTSQLMFDHRPKPQSEAQSVLDVLSTGSATLEDLVDRSGQAAVAVAAHLGWLMGAGWVVADGGWYSLAPVVR